MNPSFEQLRNCPNGLNSADSALYWDWLNIGASTNACKGELFNSCANMVNAQVGEPYNSTGYQKPRTGHTYIALQSTYFTTTATNNLRDYLKGQLSPILQAGKKYCLTFYYNAANRIEYATNRFGAYVDNGSIASYNCCKDIPIIPQVQNNPVVFMTDTLNWVKIQNSFTAIGNENTITLGNFVDSATIQFQLFNSNGSLNPAYLIDDISLIDVGLPANAGHDTTIAQNDSTYIGRASEVGLDDDCVWYMLGNTTAIDTVAGMWVKPSTTTGYVVEQNICGTITYDTVLVIVSPLGIEQLAVGDNQVTVYPNPAQNSLQLTLAGNSKIQEINLYDVLGNELNPPLNPLQGGELINLDVSSLQNGVYFIQVKTKENNYTQKVIVQR